MKCRGPRFDSAKAVFSREMDSLGHRVQARELAEAYVRFEFAGEFQPGFSRLTMTGDPALDDLLVRFRVQQEQSLRALAMQWQQILLSDFGPSVEATRKSIRRGECREVKEAGGSVHSLCAQGGTFKLNLNLRDPRNGMYLEGDLKGNWMLIRQADVTMGGLYNRYRFDYRRVKGRWLPERISLYALAGGRKVESEAVYYDWEFE